MKKIPIIFLLSFALLCLFGSFARSMSLVEELEPPRSGSAMTETSLLDTDAELLDGITLFMGVFLPLDDEMDGIYGNMFTISGQYCLNMSKSIDLLASVGYIGSGGDPYYDVPSFSSGESSTIKVFPLEVSVRKRLALTKDPVGFTSRGLYVGGGMNYIIASEKTPGLPSASGGDFGIHIFAGPQIFFTESLALEGEVKFLMNEVDMKFEDEKYAITLSGLVIRLALSWYY